MACKNWKDSVLASRSQKRAWAKRKQLNHQKERAQAKQEMINLADVFPDIEQEDTQTFTKVDLPIDLFAGMLEGYE